MNVSYCFPCWKLPDKVRHDARFPFGYRLSAVFQAFQYPCHVIAQGAHRLQSLGVLRGFARQTTMHAVPVLGAYDGHVVYREILVQPVERGACSSAPTDGYGSRRFVAQQRRRGIKQPVEQGAERTVGARIIDGRTDDDAVRRFQSRIVVYSASPNTHLPDSAQRLQAMHPCTALVPMETISVSMLFASRAFATSDKAM